MTNLAHPPRQDFETRLGNDEHDALRLWLRIMTCTNLVESEIRARLRSRFDSTLPRFDLMSQLWRHPEGLKMGEVSRRLMVTSGNVTGISWMRAPRHAPDVMAEIERSVRQAAPFPAPVRMGKVTYTDTWLWHSSGRFQLDTLTEGQI